MLVPTQQNTMSMIKEYLLLKQREEEELWESYLEWVEENQELWNQLPLNIRELVEKGVEVCYEE